MGYAQARRKGFRPTNNSAGPAGVSVIRRWLLAGLPYRMWGVYVRVSVLCWLCAAKPATCSAAAVSAFHLAIWDGLSAIKAG